MGRLTRLYFNRLLRYMRSPTNQRRSIAIGIFILCLTLMIITYVAGQDKDNYFFVLKSKIEDISYNIHLTSVRVCCLVSTTPKHFLTRARAVNATWGRRCDKLLFITEYLNANMTLEQKEFARQLPIAPIENIAVGYDRLTQKSILAFLFVYKKYYNDFDWFIKADDDTYLIMENLKDFLRKQDTTKPVTFGYNYQVIVIDGYPSGGAAYVLSREALKRFHRGHQVPNNTDCAEEEGLEDVEIAKCLRAQGVLLAKSLDEEKRELFHPLRFHEHFTGEFPKWLKIYARNPLRTHYNCCSERSISFHYMEPEQQYYLEFLLYRLRLN